MSPPTGGPGVDARDRLGSSTVPGEFPWHCPTVKRGPGQLCRRAANTPVGQHPVAPAVALTCTSARCDRRSARCDQRTVWPRTSSSTASANTRGASCGMLWPTPRHDAVRTRPGEALRIVRGVGWRAHAVVGAVEADRRHGDRRLRREASLDRGTRRVAGTRPKRWRYEWITTSTKSGLSNAAALRSKVASSKRPGRRPGLPQQLHSARRLRGQPGAAAFAVEVVLVPEPALARRASRGCIARGDVLDVVAVEGDAARRSARATAPPRCRPRGRPSRSRRAPRAESPAHPSAPAGRRRARPVARARRGALRNRVGAVAAQVRHDDAAALRGEQRRDLGVGVDVVREAVHQQHRRAVGRAGFEVARRRARRRARAAAVRARSCAQG